MTYLVLDERLSGALLLSDSPAGPVITSATPNPYSPSSTLTIVVGAEIPEGDVIISNGDYDVPQSHTDWTSSGGETTITVPVTVSGLPFAGNLTIGVTPDGQAIIQTSIAIEPPAGSAAVVINNPSFEIGSVLRGHTGNTPVNGWQMEHNDHPNTTLNPNGTFTQVAQRDFQVRVWDASDNTRGAFGSAYLASGIVEVNGGDPILAGESFPVTLYRIHSEDIAFLELRWSDKKWLLPVESVIDEEQLTFVAPDDLPADTALSLQVYESKQSRLLREIYTAAQQSAADAEAAAEAAQQVNTSSVLLGLDDTNTDPIVETDSILEALGKARRRFRDIGFGLHSRIFSGAENVSSIGVGDNAEILNLGITPPGLIDVGDRVVLSVRGMISASSTPSSVLIRLKVGPNNTIATEMGLFYSLPGQVSSEQVRFFDGTWSLTRTATGFRCMWRTHVALPSAIIWSANDYLPDAVTDGNNISFITDLTWSLVAQSGGSPRDFTIKEWSCDLIKAPGS